MAPSKLCFFYFPCGDIIQSFQSVNPEIQQIIKKLGDSVSETYKLQHIRSLLPYLEASSKPEDKQLVVNVLASIYLCTLSPPTIKTLVGRRLSAVPDANLLNEAFQGAIDVILDYIAGAKDEDKIILANSFICVLDNSLELSPVVVGIRNRYSTLFDFVYKSLVAIMGAKQSEFSITHKDIYILYSVKCIVNFLTKVNGAPTEIPHKVELIRCCYDIILNKTLRFDIKYNSGYVLVMLFATLPDDFVKDSAEGHVIFELLKFGKKRSELFEKVGLKHITDPATLQTFQICIYTGILQATLGRGLYHYLTGNEKLFSNIFAELMDLSLEIKGKQLIGIANALSFLPCYIKKVNDEEVDLIFEKCLNYIVHYLEDRIDSVKGGVQTVLKGLVAYALKCGFYGNNKGMERIFEWLSDLQGSIRYPALAAVASKAGCARLLVKWPGLPSQLLKEMTDPSNAHNITTCYKALMKLHFEQSECGTDWLVWVDPIAQELKNPKPEMSQFFQDLYVSAFKMQPVTLKSLTQEQFLNDAEISCLLACLCHTRKMGLDLPVNEVYCYETTKSALWRGLLDYETLEILLTHQNNEIRISVLTLIVDAQKSSEVFTRWELQSLVNYFKYNINAPNASVRQQLIALYKKMVTRLNINSVTLCKCTGDKNEGEFLQNFWPHMYKFVLLVGLNPDCNHLRKSACLEMIYYNAGFKYHNFVKYFTCEDFDNLKYIVQYDTYERHKEIAAALLSRAPAVVLKLESPQAVSHFIQECFKMANSIKPSETISAAYMLKVALGVPSTRDLISLQLQKLQSRAKPLNINKSDWSSLNVTCLLLLRLLRCLQFNVSAGNANLEKAAADNPFHGLLFCVRHLLKDMNLEDDKCEMYWAMVMQEIVKLCLAINKIITPIIANQSPEGFLLDDFELGASKTDKSAQAQMLTVYGWRAAKEVSLLLGELSLKFPFADEVGNAVLKFYDDLLQQIGYYFFTLLKETKHRGAFEQASVGFTDLCTKLWSLPSTVGASELLTNWLDEIFDCLLTEGSGDAYATRRSAGIPFMVQAILTTEPPNNGNKHFHACMQNLLAVAGDTSQPKEQRILSFNILRALYRHSALGDNVQPYCSRGVKIAIEGFGSSDWGIRNSSTLLFSALMVRIFGVARIRDVGTVSIKNKMLARIFFSRYAELYSFLLLRLQESHKNQHDPSLFPVLLVLSRLYNCSGSMEMVEMEAFLVSLTDCLANPVYKIRDLAAKIVANLLPKHRVPNCLHGVFLRLADVTLTNNHCHGLLLQVLYLLQSDNDPPTWNIDDFFNVTGWILVCAGQQTSHMTATVYIEVLLHLLQVYKRQAEGGCFCNLFMKMLSVTCWLEKAKVEPSVQMKTFKLYLYSLKLYVCAHIWGHCDNLDNMDESQRKLTISRMFEKTLKDADCQELCISYMNYIKFQSSELEAYSVYDEESCKHAEYINKFLKPLLRDTKADIFDILSKMNAKAYNDDKSNILYKWSFHHFYTNDHKELLREMVVCCDIGNEDRLSLVLTMLDQHLTELSDEGIKQMDLHILVDAIISFCSPVAEFSHRLAMAKLLVHNKRLFCQKDLLIKWSSACVLWQAVLVLLEDDEECIRNEISRLWTKDLTSTKIMFVPKVQTMLPELAREELLSHMVSVLPAHCSINILLSLMLRSRKVGNENLSEVFEEGVLNTYAELCPLAKVAVNMLGKVLWKLDDGLNFKDNSIFVEEQVLLIITVLFDKFQQNVVPLLSVNMNSAVKCGLTLLKKYLEVGSVKSAQAASRFTRTLSEVLANRNIVELERSEKIRLYMLFDVLIIRAALRNTELS